MIWKLILFLTNGNVTVIEFRTKSSAEECLELLKTERSDIDFILIKD